MLISPALCHDRLSAIIAQDSGPHTALLATPNGQLVSRVTKDRTVTGSSDDDEPWLDEPERIRLLLGLLSQWEDAESPRIECELGRLFVRSLHLTSTEPTTHPSLPAVRASPISRLILLVNGSSGTTWQELEQKVCRFGEEADRR